MTSGSRLLPRLRRRVVSEQAGVSLIELIVTLSILGMVVGSLGSVFVSGTNAEVDLNERFQAQSQARVALTSLRRDVHRACTATFTGSTKIVLAAYPTTAGTTSTCSTTVATWCVVGSAAPYTLFRAKASTTCGSTNVGMASNLTSSAVFGNVAAAAGSGMLPRVSVDLQVDVDPNDSRAAYRLQDSIALRNATRS